MDASHQSSTDTAMDNTLNTYDQVLIDIAAYVYHYSISNEAVYDRARHALLDALGCAIETLHVSPECTSLLGPVVAGTVVKNGFRLPGTSHQLDPVKGAFDLGSLIRYLDHNDAYPGAEWGHPSDNLGALVAVADWMSRESSSKTPNGIASPPQPPQMVVRTLLTAHIKAYEIQGALQTLNSFNAVGLDHTILVKIASTALVSWLLGLSEAQCLAALSQAFQDGHPLRTFRQSPNTSPRKGWAAGDACMRAVHLSLLTKAGQPGAPSVLTAPRWGFYDTFLKGEALRLHRPYATNVMETVFFKLIPAEGHAISAVEAALDLVTEMEKHSLVAEHDIASIKIRTQKPAFTIVNKTGILRNAADRDHCLQYIVAVVFLKRACIETVDYQDDSSWAVDTRVDRLRETITVVEDETFTADYYNQKKRSCSNAITVFLKDGSVLGQREAVVEFPVGHPGRADTLKQVREKFEKNLGLGLQKDRVKGIVERLLDAKELDGMDVREFVDMFWKGEAESQS